MGWKECEKKWNKGAQRKLDAAANGGSLWVFGKLLIFGENGVKSDFTPPLFIFPVSHARPDELATRPSELNFFFLQIFVAIIIIIYFPFKPYNYV